MKAYLIRRLFLMIPTLLGITLLVFSISRVMPGGPLEKAMQAAAMAGKGDERGGDGKTAALSESDLESLEEEYGLDKPILEAYGQWLGVLPKETLISKAEFNQLIQKNAEGDGEVRLVTLGENKITLISHEVGELKKIQYLKGGNPQDRGWNVRIESPEYRQKRWAKRSKEDISKCPKKYFYRAVVYKKEFSGLLQGQLGDSLVYGDSVWSMMLSRVPIALFFGLLSTLIVYGICLPLGVLKALKHRSWFDNLTSVFIFVGYAIPGYALGAVMVVFLGARLGWFPMFGLASETFEDLSWAGKLLDLAHHTVLPLMCYVVSSFAFLTMLMKNSLMENLGMDYVRTAMAKGVTFRQAVIKHAFRNAFIPIATNLGGIITIFVSGSMLIERVFDIRGFGMLQFEAVTTNDYPVMMGTLTISAFLMLLGNILSDVIVAMVDPRLKFQ